MFFIISKLYSFLLMPYMWLFLLLLFILIIKNQKRARKLLWITFIGFYFFSNSFIIDELTRLWEFDMTPTEKLQTYDAGIVLGGGMVQIDKKLNRVIYRNNIDRIMQAIDLYKAGKIKKILISSASGTLFERFQNESKILKPFLVRIGIPENDILIDTLSDNTRQNAVQSARILNKEFPKGKFLLITSAMHMRRAIGCFKKVGISPDLYPTNKVSGERKFYFDFMFIPNLEALNGWSGLAHEVFGYVIYAVMGYV